MGVKGKSVLALIKSWFDSSNHRMLFYLGSHIKKINKKAKQIDPPSEFIHSIRPLETISYWKASEFRSWLLHLSLPLLKDHLLSEYINHLEPLVCAMHILLSNYITPSDLSTADHMLNMFYQLSFIPRKCANLTLAVLLICGVFFGPTLCLVMKK